jgi:hypothetical protein
MNKSKSILAQYFQNFSFSKQISKQQTKLYAILQAAQHLVYEVNTDYKSNKQTQKYFRFQ